LLKKIEFEIKAVTPIVMGGGDQNNAELRAPSFKGLMRFWWRAVKGKANISDISELKKEESEIFGSADQGMGKSKFAIRVIGRVDDRYRSNVRELFNMGKPGLSYLFYPFRLQGPSDRYGYKANSTKFKIQLSSKDEDYLRIAAASFWCVVYLGGIGTRSRRGAGNLSVTKVNTMNFDHTDIEKEIKKLFASEGIESQDNVKGWYEERYKSVSNIIGNSSDFFHNPSYPILKGGGVYVLPHKTSWEEVLNVFGDKFREYRLRKQPDYDIVKSFIQTGNMGGTVDRAAFGLPLSFSYSSLQNRKADINPQNNRFDRSSSPLIFKVVEFNGKYFPVMVHLNKQLIPANGDLQIKRGNGQSRRFNQPGSSIIDNFIKSFNPQEVRL
jgi:CRISPR-associated protein Cmr1